MKIVIYRDAKGEWRWRLVARNGRILANSGEGYQRRAKLLRALNALRAVDNSICDRGESMTTAADALAASKLVTDYLLTLQGGGNPPVDPPPPPATATMFRLFPSPTGRCSAIPPRRIPR